MAAAGTPAFCRTRKKTKCWKVFADDHGYARPNPDHGAHSRDEADADQSADDAAAGVTEDFLADDLGDVDLTRHFFHWRRVKKYGVQPHVKRQDDQGGNKQ